MSRWLRGKASPGRVGESFGPIGRLDAGVLARDPNSQPLTPLLSATAERLTPPFSGHARTESLRLCTPLLSGTVGGLAHGTALMSRRKEADVRAKVAQRKEAVVEVG